VRLLLKRRSLAGRTVLEMQPVPDEIRRALLAVVGDVLIYARMCVSSPNGVSPDRTSRLNRLFNIVHNIPGFIDGSYSLGFDEAWFMSALGRFDQENGTGLATVYVRERDGAGSSNHEKHEKHEDPRHIALLGDSIFDNGTYTGGQPDVLSHLRAELGSGWKATLLAVDGSTCSDLPEQLAEVPDDVTDLVVSIGGNDALLNSDLLDLPVASTREALLLFASRAARFEGDYRAAISSALNLRRPLACCTIYNGNLGERDAVSGRAALMLFNDAILRVAFEQNLKVIDLRLVCTEPEDYANPIEPSGQGGLKIARAILKTLSPATLGARAPSHGRGAG
jgi:hypothetical protein